MKPTGEVPPTQLDRIARRRDTRNWILRIQAARSHQITGHDFRQLRAHPEVFEALTKERRC